MKLDKVEKMLQICGMSDWLGNEILPHTDPWYRFFRTIKILEKSGDIKTESKLLDLGCHQGQFLKIMQNLFSLDCFGIDYWTENLKQDHTWTYYWHDPANGIELDNKFNYISTMEVIEHMIDTDSCLEDCYNLLNDGGKLILITPNINSLRNRLYVPLGYYP